MININNGINADDIGSAVTSTVVASVACALKTGTNSFENPYDQHFNHVFQVHFET